MNKEGFKLPFSKFYLESLLNGDNGINDKLKNENKILKIQLLFRFNLKLNKYQ